MWSFYVVIVLWVLFGIIALIMPKKARLIYEKLVTPSFCKIWGVIALILGYFMWIAAFSLRIPLVAQILAVLAALKGIGLLVLPHKFIDKVYSSFKMNDLTFRIFGIIALALSYFVYTLL
ncbi:MAG: hypothetical protein GYA31_01200 [Parcubacteria group bacterium]|nr:hypothetical protein [Parcubacteria group bacterium]